MSGILPMGCVAWECKLTGMGDWTADTGLEGREVTGRGTIIIFNSVKGFYILKGEVLLELALEVRKRATG